MADFPRLTRLQIDGYRPFREFTADFTLLTVIVGANGAGKSSLFEFLRFIRDGVVRGVPPEIMPDKIGSVIFHRPGNDVINLRIGCAGIEQKQSVFEAEVLGPIGGATIVNQNVERYSGDGKREKSLKREYSLLREKYAAYYSNKRIDFPVYVERLIPDFWRNEDIIILGMTNFISRWKFFSGFVFDAERVKRASLVYQDASLAENCHNLNSLLHSLFTEHRPAFEELQEVIRAVMPGFGGLTVKARGGPGEVMAFWAEGRDMDYDLTLADLSDGILRFLCWAALCLHPNPPSLVCVDEPELGLHPRVLPLLAGLFKRLSERTQVVIATHSSYFLAQFALADLAVMTKKDGRAQWLRPADSRALAGILEDFGAEELESLHRSDELEALA